MLVGRRRLYRLKNGEMLLYFMCGGFLLLFLGQTSTPTTVVTLEDSGIQDVGEDTVYSNLSIRLNTYQERQQPNDEKNLIGTGMTTVAIGCAIAIRGRLKGVTQNELQTLPFYKSLLPSFCVTASPGFHYRFYIAYDFDDPFFSQEGSPQIFHREFFKVTRENCSRDIRVSIHFVKCSHSHRPAWAQNDAMMEAYLDDVDFYYRINDDTIMRTHNWTEVFINTLKNYDPPWIGVVGPSYMRRKKRILTYDFVHKVHFDIFGFYYPRIFGDWYADRWITDVYQPGRSTKLQNVKLVHTLAVGTRYKAHRGAGRRVGPRIQTDKAILERYINNTRNPSAKKSQNKKVISMSLYGSNPKYTYGTIRNAQLLPLYFPNWTLRIYVENPLNDGTTKYPKVPTKVINKLIKLGVDIKYINPALTEIKPMMWRFLVADDMNVDYFLIRDCDSRFSDRDAMVIEEWMATGKAFHCARDHPSHGRFPVSGGLWGGKPKELLKITQMSFEEMMKGYRARYLQDMNFLGRVVWTKVRNNTFCHDSVTCTKWVSSHPFPVTRKGGEHLGQVFDAYGQPRGRDMVILRKHKPNTQCTKNTTKIVSNAMKQKAE